MQNTDENLPKIDRWASIALDVHKWSHHPEIKDLTDRLYTEAGVNSLDKSGNKKPKKTARDMLRVLLIDVYVKWLEDPALAIGFTKDKMAYKVNGNRYNKVFISEKIVAVEQKLFDSGFLEELPAYHDKTGREPSYTTRIRHSAKLRLEFQKLTVDLHDIQYGVDQEVIILREKFQDELGLTKKALINYDDTDLTNRLREQLTFYNELLRRTFIDIPSQTEPFITRLVTKGRQSGQEQRISIGPDNKHVHRVFNGNEDDNWTKGGRFYGGWWLQIPREMRKEIYINDKPIVEVDYKALHPNLLLLEAHADTSVRDPYDLQILILPDLITELPLQRDVVKSLILMAINATSSDAAFQAFRKSKKRGDPNKKLKNLQLQLILDAFTDRFPGLKDALNSGKALELMNKDSQIANIVIDYFTQKNLPILCIHDSFCIQHDKEDELRRVLNDASVQIVGKPIPQDSKSITEEIKVHIRQEVDGIEKRIPDMIRLPKRIRPTDQYRLRKMKHQKWLETVEEPKKNSVTK